MKKLILSLIIFGSVSSFAQTHGAVKAEEAPKDIIIHRNCRKAENKPCISLDFDTLDKKIIADQKKMGSDTEYTLKIFGKLDRGAEKEHLVKFIGSEGNCTNFGKGTAGVLGFSNSGNPIVLTEEGNLEITSKFVRVGANNIQIANTKGFQREAFLSRSINTDPYAISRIHFDSSGDAYLLDGMECFEIRKRDLFRKVDIKRCESKKSESKDPTLFERLKIKDNQKVYEIKDSSNVLIVDLGTCS